MRNLKLTFIISGITAIVLFIFRIITVVLDMSFGKMVYGHDYNTVEGRTAAFKLDYNCRVCFVVIFWSLVVVSVVSGAVWIIKRSVKSNP